MRVKWVCRPPTGGTLDTEGKGGNEEESGGINDTTRSPRSVRGGSGLCSNRETSFHRTAEWWKHTWACTCSIRVKEVPSGGFCFPWEAEMGPGADHEGQVSGEKAEKSGERL